MTVRSVLALCALASTASADRRCVIEKMPVVVVPKLTEPKCHRASKALEKSLTTAIAKDFSPTQDGGKPKITFPCDGLGDRVDEIVLETGSGHGGTLHLYRAKRNGDTYDVRGIAFSRERIERVAGRVVIDIDKLRAATTATVTEELPPPKPDEISIGGGMFSSNDFHVLIRLRDREGRVVERAFTGYQSSTSQNEFLQLRVAEEVLLPVIALATNQDKKQTQPIDADDRALFADRFNAAIPHFDEEYYWWVMESYVSMARTLGTPHVIAGLLTRMKLPRNAADPEDRSHVDARHDALEALANITGWDARKNNATDETAAAAYVAECQ